MIKVVKERMKHTNNIISRDKTTTDLQAAAQIVV